MSYMRMCVGGGGMLCRESGKHMREGTGMSVLEELESLKQNQGRCGLSNFTMSPEAVNQPQDNGVQGFGL